jgi:hypothetical protein
MDIDSSGNVLVGTATSYGGALTLIPSANPTTASATTSQLRIGESSANTAYSLNINYMLNAGVYKGSLQAIAGGSPADLLLNADGGKVGIGTSSPTRKFHVKDDGLGSMKVESGGTSDTFLEMQTSSNRAYIGIDESLNLLKINNTGTLGSDTHLAIDSSGIVTKPYQPSFQAHGTGGHTTYSGVFHMNSTSTNTGGHYSTASSRFTAPVAGNYYFTCSLNIYGPNTAACAWYIRKNGTDIIRADQDGTHGGWKTQTISGVLTLGVNDYVDVYLNSNTYVASASWTHFSGHLIG